jgi:hypothetical protein
METHFEDEIEELCQAGFSAPEAVDEATRRFGRPKDIGREIYEVYNWGTWSQALLAGVPHLLIAVTFALHLWRASSWLLFVSLVVAGVTVYAWRHGRPAWCYSWLGYFVMILLAAVFLVLFIVGRSLALFMPESSALWVAVVVYVAVALGLFGCIVVRVVRRDWLFASLMLLPFPVILVWLIALENDVGLAEYTKQGFQSSDLGVALTFLALAGVAGIFIRLRQRLLKISALSLGMLLIQAMVWRFTESGFNTVICFLFALFLTCLLVSPVILQNKVVHREEEVEASDNSLPEQVVRRT